MRRNGRERRKAQSGLRLLITGKANNAIPMSEPNNTESSLLK